MNNYPEEIYKATNESGKEWAERVYDLGREHAKQEATTEPEWHNLTEQIAAGADIDWEKLNGVKARCVHAEIGALTHEMTRRDRNFQPENILGWGFAYQLIEAFRDSWEGINGWTLYIDRPVPFEA